MSYSKVARVAGALVALASQVAAHGHVTGIVADGVYYEGYSTTFQYWSTAPPVTVGWSIPQDNGNGFVSDYTSPDIICHLGATNAGASAAVSAGGYVNLQWTTWPSSHHGPVIDYLANCNGDCATVDKTTLKWFKIDGIGLIDDTNVPGTWATDQLIANNNSWTVDIPSSIAPGNYVLRHEIIALHSAGTQGNAQNYPQCVNLIVSGSGTDNPAGTLGESLYKASDPGLVVNIYSSLSSYTVPGPTQYSGATATATQSGGATATSIAPVGTTTQVYNSANGAAVVAPTNAGVATTSTSAAAPVYSAASPSSSSSKKPCSMVTKSAAAVAAVATPSTSSKKPCSMVGGGVATKAVAAVSTPSYAAAAAGSSSTPCSNRANPSATAKGPSGGYNNGRVHPRHLAVHHAQ